MKALPTEKELDELLEILRKINEKSKFTDKEIKILKKTKIYPLVKEKL